MLLTVPAVPCPQNAGRYSSSLQISTAFVDTAVAFTKRPTMVHLPRSLLLVSFCVFVVFQPQSAWSYYCFSSTDCWDQGPGPWACCNNECVQDSSCLGRYCVLQSECSSSESCCNDVCVVGSGSCLGQSCSISLDCYSGEQCCYGTCRMDCVDVIYVAVGIVFGVCLIVVFVVVIVVRRRHRRAEVRRPLLVPAAPAYSVGPQFYSEPPAPVVFAGQAPYQNFATNTASNPDPSAQPPPYKQ